MIRHGFNPLTLSPTQNLHFLRFFKLTAGPLSLSSLKAVCFSVFLTGVVRYYSKERMGLSPFPENGNWGKEVAGPFFRSFFFFGVILSRGSVVLCPLFRIEG